MNIRYLINILFLILLISQSIYGDEIQYKWNNIAGKWKTTRDIDGTYLYEQKCKYRKWNYSELVNYNTIATLDSIKSFEKYNFSYQVKYPIKPVVEVMLFFAMKNYRDFYAFKYTIEENNAEIQFIGSKITDPSLKPAIKNNFTISVIDSKKYNFAFDKSYNIEIKINENKAELYIDGKKEMEAMAPENLNSGKLGFSSRNAQMRVDDIKVYDKGNIVFQDDFSEDSIKRWKVQASRVKKK